MNLTQYNTMPEGDTKLAVRLAITMGWDWLACATTECWVYEILSGKVYSRKFNPFTDPSIPYGLPVSVYKGDISNEWSASCDGYECSGPSKTHAIIDAFCESDPLGRWARFTEVKA
jgi:hypothetical protein